MKLAGRVLTRGAEGTDMPEGVKPPARRSDTEPLQLSTVFRGVQVLQTAITGLPVVEQRGGRDLPDVSPLVLQPDVSRSRRDFIADIVASLVLDGTAGDIKVLGKALEYVPLDMKPADLQFLETQKFDTTQIARLLGIPASIMLAAVDGSNLTYSNIEQSWIEFADYTLAAYTGEIEEIFNRLLPRGRTAKFDWDSSQRANMSDRYTAYKTAIEAGFLTVDDVRRKEGLPALVKGEDQ